MLIKYFEKGKGRTGPVEYALKNKTAKVIKGNPELTKQLIKNNKNKLKYRSGVISFGMNRPNKRQLDEILELFEKSTFAGLEKHQYNILFVEHSDTDNYHIHFIIPRLELTTMKAFNPHWHKADQERLLKLQAYINSKFNFINPFEVGQRQTNLLKNLSNKKNLKKKELEMLIYKTIDEAFINGLIKNRNDIVQFLKDAGFKVKVTKKNITIVREGKNSNIRLKGVLYDENFRSREELKQYLETKERENRTNSREELERLREELERLIQYKANQNRKQYTKRNRKNIKRSKELKNTEKQSNDLANMVGHINISISNNIYSTDENNRIERELGKYTSYEYRQDENFETKEYGIKTNHQKATATNHEIAGYYRRETDEDLRFENRFDELQGGINDSIRTAVEGGIGTSANEERELIEKLRKTGTRIYIEYEEINKQVYGRYAGDSKRARETQQRSIELIESIRGSVSRIANSISGIAGTIKKRLTEVETSILNTFKNKRKQKKSFSFSR